MRADLKLDLSSLSKENFDTNNVSRQDQTYAVHQNNHRYVFAQYYLSLLKHVSCNVLPVLSSIGFVKILHYHHFSPQMVLMMEVEELLMFSYFILIQQSRQNSFIRIIYSFYITLVIFFIIIILTNTLTLEKTEENLHFTKKK